MDGKNGGDILDVWQRETDLATSEAYRRYLLDGDTRGLSLSQSSKMRSKRCCAR